MLKFAPRSRKPWLRLMRGRIQTWWQRTMNQPGSADRVARGAALGFFIGWLPLVGVQMGLAFGLCTITRASFIASLPGVWLSNPVTMVPMYFFINRVGAHVVGKAITWQEMENIWRHVSTLGIMQGTRYLFVETASVTLAMLVGGTIIGLINAFIAYPIVVRLVHRYQRHWAARRDHWRRRTRPAVIGSEPPPAAPVPGSNENDPPNQFA